MSAKLACVSFELLHALTYRQLQFLAQRNASGSGAGTPVRGGAGVGGGALRGVLLRLAAGVTGGALRLEHLPPKVLPAQQSARDLFLTAGTERERRKVYTCIKTLVFHCDLVVV